MTKKNEDNDEENAKLQFDSSDSSSFQSEIIENDDCFPDENEIEIESKSNSSDESFEETEPKPRKPSLQPFSLLDYLKYNSELRRVLDSDMGETQIFSKVNSIINTDAESSVFDLSTLKDQIEQYRAENRKKVLSMIQEESKDILFSTIQPQVTQEDLAKAQKSDESVSKPMAVVKEIDSPSSKDAHTAKSNKAKAASSNNMKPIDVHERLYNKRKPFKLDIVEVPLKSSKNTTSGNSRSNTRDYFTRLNKDLERRSKAKKDNEANRGKTPNVIRNIQVKQIMSTNKLLYSKYIQTYTDTVEELASSSLISSNVSFAFEDIVLIFQRLNFITQQPRMSELDPNSRTTTSSNSRQSDLKRIQELFESTKEPQTCSVVNHHLFLFTLSMLGLADYHNSLQKGSRGSRAFIAENRKYSSFDLKGNLLISPSQSRAIFRAYQSMYQSWKRTFHHHNRHKTPELTSVMMKDKGRLRSYSNDSINRQLLHYKLHKTKMALLKQESEAKEVSQCTFKPALTGYHSKDFALSKFLFSSTQLSKKNSKDNLPHHKEREEKYSFKPKINTIKVCQVKELFSNANSQKDSYDIGRHNERMRKGRKERSKKQNAFKLRYNTDLTEESFNPNALRKNINDNDNASSSPFLQMKQITMNLRPHSNLNDRKQLDSQADSLNERKLLVIIDIKINNVNRRLLAYEGDTAEDLSSNFIADNNVPQEKALKLKALIQSELDKAKLLNA